MARIVEPEDRGVRMLSCEVADLRVVAVHDQRGACRKRRDRRPPALCDKLQLPVAVELVAEEIAETDGAGP